VDTVWEKQHGRAAPRAPSRQAVQQRASMRPRGGFAAAKRAPSACSATA